MPRIDDYKAAKEIAVQKLSNRPLSEILAATGFEASAAGQIRIPFLDRTYLVDFPELTFKDQQDPDKAVPIQEQVLILHYMLPKQAPEPSGRWVAYREIPGAAFYFSAFVKRAIEPLKKAFGQNPDGLDKASKVLNGKKVAPGDAAFEFMILPKVPLQVILWAGDDEFPAEANILFDQTVGDILSPEDAAWLAGMLVYRLISISYR
jgi:hypothetical protein